jgi:predicted GH43/DUF377 family glycosyl hydrolase
LTYRKTTQWNDPLGVGWKSGSIFNCSLIEHDNKLFMFYRAAPKKETVCSRIGLAVYQKDKGWADYENNPVIFPTEDNEILGCEDPKIYKLDDKFIMFYHGIWNLAPETKNRITGMAGFPIGVACDIKIAISKDLYHWEKCGLVVPYDVSKYWAKAAVIPKNPKGEPEKIEDKYLMYISEGCGGKQYIGYSDDMLNWKFKQQNFLNIGQYGTLYEVACAVSGHEETGKQLVLDYYYRQPNGKNAGGQALYDISEPFKQIALNRGATLSWGGLIQYEGKWMFAQGWDAPNFTEEIYFYECPVKK